MEISATNANKSRTAATVRQILKEYNSTLAPTQYMFSQKGQVVIAHAPSETLWEDAIEAGAEDVIEEEGGCYLVTAPDSASSVADAMSGKRYEVGQVKLIWTPNEYTQNGAQELEDLLEDLSDHDDVVGVYHTLKQ